MALISKRGKKDSPEISPEPVESQVRSIPTNFLGTRTMDVASASQLHPVFQSILESAREVKEALAEGIVNEREAAVRLNQLRARDNRGALWTVGLQSLLWYRRIGNSKWVSSPSPLGPSNDDPIGPWYAVSGRPKKGDVLEGPVAVEGSVELPETAAPKEIGEKPAALTQWQGTQSNGDESDGSAAAAHQSELESRVELGDTTDSVDELYAMIVSSGISESDDFGKIDVLAESKDEQLSDVRQLLKEAEAVAQEMVVEAKPVKKVAAKRTTTKKASAKKVAAKEVKPATEVVDFTEELD